MIAPHKHGLFGGGVLAFVSCGSPGPSILSELIQNADDARASTVKVLYNTRSYGTASLLGKPMAKWQGPALCVYNDAAFSPRDFQNLVKIGQVTTARVSLRAL